MMDYSTGMRDSVSSSGRILRDTTNQQMSRAGKPENQQAAAELQDSMKVRILELQTLMLRWVSLQTPEQQAGSQAQVNNVISQMQQLQHDVQNLPSIGASSGHYSPSMGGSNPNPRSYNPERGVRPARGGRVSDSKVGPDLDRDCIVAVVEFKRQRMKRFACNEFVDPGQYVIVDGDRGQDCGFVVYCSVRNADGSLGRTESIDNIQLDVNRIKSESGVVRGIASEADVELLHGEIASSERQALKTCRELVARMHLPMEVVDCEFQFDRKKISFYFESSRSVDFRELNTELFRIFGVRIWLENQNNKVKNVVPDGAVPHTEKVMYQTMGGQPFLNPAAPLPN